MNVRPTYRFLIRPSWYADPRGPREADCRRRPGIGNGHHEVGDDRSLARQGLAHADTRGMHLLRVQPRVRSGEVDELEQTKSAAGRLDDLMRLEPAVDHDELARTHVTFELGADEVERAGLGGQHPVVAEPPDDQRSEAERVAEAEQPALGEGDDRRGAFEPAERVADRVRERSGIVGDQRADQLGVGGRRRSDTVLGELRAQLLGIRQVAVVPERDDSRAAVVDERLCVRPVRRPCRRVARVPDRDIALEPAQRLLREDLRDEAHVPEDGQAALVGDRDPRRFLAAVLKREEPEVRDACDIAIRRADAEHAAHLDGSHLLGEIGDVVAGEDEANRVGI